MVEPDSYEESLEQAEASCFAVVCEVLGLRKNVDATIPTHILSLPDGAVFDIGFLQSPELAAFPSDVYHFRASLDLRNRSRAKLQRWIMRLLGTMHVGHNYMPSCPLRSETNVTDFRIAPEQGCISAIELSTVPGGEREIPTFSCTVLFDVVFLAKGTGGGVQDADFAP